MSDNEVIFYEELNYGGASHPYKLGDDINLGNTSLNDKFTSVKVGAKVKVVAWQHYDQTGVYREWDVDQPDITDIGGLTRFRVVKSGTLPIAVRLEDLTGQEKHHYSMKVDSHDVGTAKVYSGGAGYGLVGLMPEAGPPVTTAIYVRDEKSGVYVATGSIYFTWDGETKSIRIDNAENFPKNMEHQRERRNEFTCQLKSVS
ncbi:beta/gamma crystallin domain-containing protein [Nocardiopsis lucentensis]|uniref:beta/gamma crystallin domain-containing protein n=1 Tax=Nocardiopsis lucentensis TaxID=53441 RepID=UPI000347E6FF|nr:beta/gamma crystallin domain-containing protein [Nocardiopsis lucentensis]